MHSYASERCCSFGGWGQSSAQSASSLEVHGRLLIIIRSTSLLGEKFVLLRSEDRRVGANLCRVVGTFEAFPLRTRNHSSVPVDNACAVYTCSAVFLRHLPHAAAHSAIRFPLLPSSPRDLESPPLPLTSQTSIVKGSCFRC